MIFLSFSNEFTILMSSAFLVGSFFNLSYVTSSFSISFILSWYSFVSMMTVVFPLSAGSMVMNFSFYSPFKAILSCRVKFCFGAFADFRTPAMSARSFSFCSCGRLHVIRVCGYPSWALNKVTYSSKKKKIKKSNDRNYRSQVVTPYVEGESTPSTEEIWSSNSHASPYHPQTLVGISQGQGRARRTG